MYRHATSTISCLLTGVSAAALAGNSTAQCTEGLQMIVSRGTGEKPGPGATVSVTNQIAEQIEGSLVHAIDYPAQFDDPVYFISVQNGTQELARTLKYYAEECPDTKLALFGYSQVSTLEAYLSD